MGATDIAHNSVVAQQERRGADAWDRQCWSEVDLDDARVRRLRAQDQAFLLVLVTNIDSVFRRAGDLFSRLDARGDDRFALEPAGAGQSDRLEDVVVGAASAEMAGKGGTDRVSRRRRAAIRLSPLLAKRDRFDDEPRRTEAALQRIERHERLLHRMQPSRRHPFDRRDRPAGDEARGHQATDGWRPSMSTVHAPHTPDPQTNFSGEPGLIANDVDEQRLDIRGMETSASFKRKLDIVDPRETSSAASPDPTIGRRNWDLPEPICVRTMITEVRKRVQSGRSGGAASARGRGKATREFVALWRVRFAFAAMLTTVTLTEANILRTVFIPHGNQAASRAYSQAAMLASASRATTFSPRGFPASAYSTGNINDSEQNSRHTALGWGLMLAQHAQADTTINFSFSGGGVSALARSLDPKPAPRRPDQRWQPNHAYHRELFRYEPRHFGREYPRSGAEHR